MVLFTKIKVKSGKPGQLLLREGMSLWMGIPEKERPTPGTAELAQNTDRTDRQTDRLFLGGSQLSNLLPEIHGANVFQVVLSNAL